MMRDNCPRKPHNYTDVELDWLRENYQRLSRVPLTEAFNHTFGATVSVGALVGALARHKIYTCRDTRYKTGLRLPGQGEKKGKKSRGCMQTWFKPGNIPVTIKPVGSERVWQRSNPYCYVKVAHPNVWRLKHVVLWESVHGKVQPGHIVIFLDGDSKNIVIENLVSLRRNVAIALNADPRYKQLPARLKPVYIQAVQLEIKAKLLQG